MQITTEPSPTESIVSTWREPIDSVGTDQFPAQLMRTLETWVGVEHYAAFDMTQENAQLLATDEALAGQRSAAILAHAASHFRCSGLNNHLSRHASGTVMVRLNTAQLSGGEPPPGVGLLEFTDGVFASGERDGHVFGLALMRTAQRGRFAECELDTLRSVAGTWLSLLAKHERMLRHGNQSDRSPELLSSVEQIETTLMTRIPALTKRETQVCARILRGISTPGIAIDLGVREDSVATYRKRAYRRLAIGSRFELIQLFVGGGASAGAAWH